MSEGASQGSNLSRRGFLKGAGVVAGGLTVAGMFSGLTGCSSGSDKNTSAAGTAMAGDYPVVVHETDVVVVGGGLAACTAARRVIQSGKSLAIIDKGAFGHSGTSGQNWGSDMSSGEMSADGGEGFFQMLVTDFFGLVDQDWAWSIVQAHREGMPMLTVEKMGCTCQRNPDGTVFGSFTDQTATGTVFGNKVRRHAQHLRRLGASVYEYTMVVDILQDDEGRCSGVVAIDLKTGEAHVFRSKSVVMGTGVYSWGLKPTIMGPEDTGDGHAIMARHGLALYDMEMTCFDYHTHMPYGTMAEIPEGAGIFTLNASVWDRGVNSKGEAYAAPYFTSEAHTKNPAGGFVNFSIYTLRENVVNGETIHMKTSGLNRNDPDFNPYYPYGMMHAYPIDAKWGLGFEYAEAEPCIQSSITSCGHPKQKANMETDIPGLFSAVQALTYYGQAQSFGQGWVAGAAAAELADGIDLPAVNFSEVQDILAKQYGHIEREAASGALRSVKVLESIRNASYYALQYPREAGKLNDGIAEYARIRTEELPNMYCDSKSRILNRDWKNAMEADNLLMCMEACALSSSAREETRPWFYRSDFPKIDNESWLKNVTATYKGDGSWDMGTDEVNMSRLGADEVKPLLMDVDLNAEL